jgi:hypothetical protein
LKPPLFRDFIYDAPLSGLDSPRAIFLRYLAAGGPHGRPDSAIVARNDFVRRFARSIAYSGRIANDP